MDHPILQGLERVARRYRLVRLAWLLSFLWACLAIAFSWLSLQSLTGRLGGDFSLPVLGNVNAIHLSWLIALGIGLLTAIGCSAFTYRDRHWTASQVEQTYPDLKQRLLTLLDPRHSDSPTFLRQQLIAETSQHAQHNSWAATVPSQRLLMAWGIQLLALLLAYYAGTKAHEKLNRSNGLANVLGAHENANPNDIVVEPGDARIERGTDLVVTIRFPEAAVPANAWIESTAETKVSPSEPTVPPTMAPSLMAIDGRISLSRSLSDPIFGGHLRQVAQNLQYRVTAAGYESPIYKVQVFDYPALAKADALITPPEYLNEPARQIEDTRRATVADGGSVQWQLTVNKPLTSVSFANSNGEKIVFAPHPDDELVWIATIHPTETMRWELNLLDDEGRNAKFIEKFSVQVLPNEQPVIQLARAQDIRVSPLQEVLLQATIRDDFGFQRSGITLSLGDAEPSEFVLDGISDKKGAIALAHTVDMELLQAEPDQLLAYYFWAEDLDSAGQVRRVEGDMFFAEVRPFEEIFREGDPAAAEEQQNSSSQQPSGSQSAQQAEQLAELQKKIITSTWNLLRQMPPSEKELPTANENPNSTDLDTLLDAQTQALQQTEPLAESLQDDRSRSYLTDVQNQMREAISQLEASRLEDSKLHMRNALANERKAYEGLLKLRAREHSIVRARQASNPSSSQNGAQQNRQEQIDQLELEEDESQYQSQQQAQSNEPTTADRESRQVMNRLDELAKRQKDLNEQLQQLETALREAKSPEEKEEIEEQLKRLRENQEEMLRDTDELLERMDQPDNRQAMQEAREEVEQARQQLQQSSQSLSQGETSAARNSGTRAQRQMDETREQMRRDSSSQLQQDMQSLVEQARRVEAEQQRLQNQLSPSDSLQQDEPNQLADTTSDAMPGTESDPAPLPEDATPLRPSGVGQDRSEDQKAWNQLKADVDQLLEQIKETVQESETSEPLLAERLYDSYREAMQQKLDQKLEHIQQLLDRGLQEPAGRLARGAGPQFERLRSEIEAASEQILGSEQESLRRALSELEQSRNAINDELRQQTSLGEGTPPPSEPAGPPAAPLAAPLTGEGYQAWSDRLRDAEELVRDQELKVEISRVREAAREMRIEYRRHASDPNWDLVDKLIVNPLDQIYRKVNEELLRQASEKNALVPIDRDPVPRQFQRQLDQYYENLGRGRDATQP